MPFPVLIARRYHVQWILLLATVEVLAFRRFTGLTSVPGRSGDTEWVLGPLLPALSALLIPSSCSVAFEDSERVLPAPILGRKLMIVAIHFVTSFGAAALGFGWNDDGAGAARNGLLLGGVSFCAAVSLPAAIAWAPTVVVATATWILGVPEPGAAIPRWALLLHDVRDVPAIATTVVVEVVGITAFALHERPQPMA